MISPPRNFAMALIAIICCFAFLITADEIVGQSKVLLQIHNLLKHEPKEEPLHLTSTFDEDQHHAPHHGRNHTSTTRVFDEEQEEFGLQAQNNPWYLKVFDCLMGTQPAHAQPVKSTMAARMAEELDEMEATITQANKGLRVIIKD